MTPGSPEAIKQGCKCPIMDNRRGVGIPDPRNPQDIMLTRFWVNEECPVHSNPKTTFSSVIIGHSGHYERDPQ